MAVEKATNTLRGGKNKYGSKTLVGNWVEGRHEPEFGGTRRDVLTTTALAELESTGVKPPKFGNGLRDKSAKFDDTIDYGNVVEYDKKAGAETWKSITRSTHARPSEGKSTEFKTAYVGPSHPTTSSKEALEEYREKWSRENAGAASRRFTSQNTRAINRTVTPKYQTTGTRRLPGVPKPVEDFRDKIVERGGLNGIRALARIMRIMDDSGDGKLSRVEFKNGLLDYGLEFNETEFFSLFRFFDKDGNDFISYDEFVRGIRAPMNDRRRAMVELAYGVLDRDGSGIVDITDIRMAYDVSVHPDVLSGKLTADEALSQFLSQWDRTEKDGKVTLAEFTDYYEDISASVFNDDEFELIIRNAWHIAGGEGVCENTANLRVLATLEDGSMQVVCVNNDLGLKKTDEAEIIRRLAEQGVKAIDISLNL